MVLGCNCARCHYYARRCSSAGDILSPTLVVPDVLRGSRARAVSCGPRSTLVSTDGDVAWEWRLRDDEDKEESLGGFTAVCLG